MESGIACHFQVLPGGAAMADLGMESPRKERCSVPARLLLCTEPMFLRRPAVFASRFFAILKMSTWATDSGSWGTEPYRFPRLPYIMLAEAAAMEEGLPPSTGTATLFG